MYYKEKDRFDSYFIEQGKGSHRWIHRHRFTSCLSPTNPSSRKVEIIKMLVQRGLYESDDKIRIAAANLLKFLLK